MSPSTPIEVRVQRSNVINLDTMDKVTLVKVFKFIPVKTKEEALKVLGTQDESAYVQVLNEGVIAELRRRAVNDSSKPWQALDEDTGEAIDFKGTPANMKLLNEMIRVNSRVLGLTPDSTPEERKAIRAEAIELIRASKRIMEGLRASAAASLQEE